MSRIPSLSGDALAHYLARGYRLELSLRLSPPPGGGPLPRPGKMTFRQVQLPGGPSMPFQLFVGLPTPNHPDDVTGRRLTLTVDDGEPTDLDVDPTVAEFELPGRYEDGQVLALSLVDLDSKSNPSPPMVASHTVVDDVGPDQPGPITFRSVQVFDDTPTP